MTDRQIVILHTAQQREFGKRLIDAAPEGYVMTLAEMTRTLEQNSKLWPMLADVRRAKPDGRQHTDETWKSLFMHSLGHQQLFERALDDRGVVPLGFRTSQLGKRAFSDLIECIYEYGSRHDIRWSEPETHFAERRAA
jgi:hypothetical protein